MYGKLTSKIVFYNLRLFLVTTIINFLLFPIIFLVCKDGSNFFVQCIFVVKFLLYLLFTDCPGHTNHITSFFNAFHC